MARPKFELKSILAEALVVVAVGVALALAANAVSPRGLDLSRNYFPAGHTNTAPVAVKSVTPVTPVATNTAPGSSSEADELSQRLRDKGLQELKRPAVETAFHDPRTQQGRIIFVDARDEDHYADGHIPGAYEFNPYHPEKEMGNVVPVCQAAEMVVVYCTGGECEDADTAAIMLRDAGIAEKKIFVYGGGFTEWSDASLPLELGPRNSGNLKSTK